MNITTKTEKRIAKNTIFLMVRMASLMALNLMAVRFVRKGLGIEDFGIQSAITGVVQLLVCLNVVLSVSGQRFLSMAMGEGNTERMKSCFGVCLRLSWLLSGFVFVVMETVGLWFVATQMSYPAGRFDAVMVIYQSAIFTFVSMLMQIPFLSAVMAHEKMDFFAGITIFEGVVKFCLALSLTFCPMDRMIYYGCGLMVASMVSTFFYIFYACKNFEEVSFHKVNDNALFRDMFFFTGWSLFGAISGALMLQGNMLLLNVQVGIVANAAYAVALQIFNAYNVLGNNVVTAVKPQLTMNYSKGNYAMVNRLLGLTHIALLIVTALVAIPLCVWMPQILELWLEEVDALTIDFCRLMLVAGMVLLFGTPITSLMQAAGRVKEYHLLVETITVLSMPVAWVLLHFGFQPQCVCWSIIICVIIAHVCRIERLWRYYIRK